MEYNYDINDEQKDRIPFLDTAVSFQNLINSEEFDNQYSDFFSDLSIEVHSTSDNDVYSNIDPSQALGMFNNHLPFNSDRIHNYDSEGQQPLDQYVSNLNQEFALEEVVVYEQGVIHGENRIQSSESRPYSVLEIGQNQETILTQATNNHFLESFSIPHQNEIPEVQTFYSFLGFDSAQDWMSDLNQSVNPGEFASAMNNHLLQYDDFDEQANYSVGLQTFYSSLEFELYGIDYLDVNSFDQQYMEIEEQGSIEHLSLPEPPQNEKQEIEQQKCSFTVQIKTAKEIKQKMPQHIRSRTLSIEKKGKKEVREIDTSISSRRYRSSSEGSLSMKKMVINFFEGISTTLKRIMP